MTIQLQPQLIDGMLAYAGFPSPAEDFKVRSIDLNETLIPHPTSTFLIRASGSSMINAGIFPGDTLVVDRSISPGNQDIVVASVHNELMVKRLKLHHGTLHLLSDNSLYKPIRVSRDEGIFVWGVVTYIIHPAHSL